MIMNENKKEIAGLSALWMLAVVCSALMLMSNFGCKDKRPWLLRNDGVIYLGGDSESEAVWLDSDDLVFDDTDTQVEFVTDSDTDGLSFELIDDAPLEFEFITGTEVDPNDWVIEVGEFDVVEYGDIVINFDGIEVAFNIKDGKFNVDYDPNKATESAEAFFVVLKDYFKGEM